MVKMSKMLKLNELQKENVSSKAMQSIVGGATCGCGYTCLDYGDEVDEIIGSQAAQLKYCGCN